MTTKMQAMVVDDSKAMRMILKCILSELGFEVCEAADGAQALDQLRGGSHADLALVDWHMPNMTGLELVQALRTDPAWDALRIVMVTSETDAAHMASALAAGANEYIMKPFDSMVVLGKLEMLGLADA